MEQLGGDGEVAFAGKALGDVADVGVDAEDFLKDHDAGARGAFRMRYVGAHGGAVTDGEVYEFGFDGHRRGVRLF